MSTIHESNGRVQTTTGLEDTQEDLPILEPCAPDEHYRRSPEDREAYARWTAMVDAGYPPDWEDEDPMDMPRTATAAERQAAYLAACEWNRRRRSKCS